VADAFYDALRDRLSAEGVRVDQVDPARFMNALLSLSSGQPARVNEPAAPLSLTGPDGILEVRQSVALLDGLNQGSKNPMGLFIAASTPKTAAALAPLAGPHVKVVDASGVQGRVDVGVMAAAFEQWADGRARGGRLSLSVSRSPNVELSGVPPTASAWLAKALDIMGKGALASQEFLLYLRSASHIRRMA
jgi:hypothetical protein